MEESRKRVGWSAGELGHFMPRGVPFKQRPSFVAEFARISRASCFRPNSSEFGYKIGWLTMIAEFRLH
jgi:hypothetical protein